MSQIPRYSIVDIETTGSKAGVGRITEIAIYVMEGHELVDEFATLINPECTIPTYISRLTGITDDMVADAPRFFEVARRIVEITDHTIFVAHNAPFDYNFLKKEFENLGYDYVRDVLCTVRLSRKIIPGHPTYSLGRLCDALGIPLSNRHRAAGDAHATVLLLQHLMVKQGAYIFPQEEFDARGLNPALNMKKINDLPVGTGIYFFHNAANDVIYIGKSRNIRKRVFSHLSAKGKRNLQMKEQLVDVSYEITGSELVALLRESDNIKQQKPLYNRVGRNSRFNWGIFAFSDRRGYQRFFIDRINGGPSQPLDAFSTRENAIKSLSAWVDEYDLCHQLSGLENKSGTCFKYSVHQCNGACNGDEDTQKYNARVQKLLEKLNFSASNFVIFDDGTTPDEKSFVWIEKNVLRGYGWLCKEDVITNPSQLEEHISGGTDNRDTRQIIRTWLRSKTNSKIKVLKY